MGRKQSQSAESVWRDRLARFRKSHLTVAEFCRQESVSDPSFYQWRKRLGEGPVRSRQVRRSRAPNAAQPGLSIVQGERVPKSKLGQALSYMRNHWEALKRFLSDARLPIDNNEAERDLRRVAVGRRNWLFVGSEEDGDHPGGRG